MDPFIGQIMMFAGNFAPRGWAFCDGNILAVSSNSALFSILGTTYGGDGRTTFALPDLRGRVAIHPGNGPGLDGYKLGQRGGNQSTVINQQNLPAHSHGLVGSDQPAAQPSAKGGYFPSNSGRQGAALYASSQGTAQTLGESTLPVGNNLPISNIQPFGCVNYIICLQGVYPSRS